MCPERAHNAACALAPTRGTSKPTATWLWRAAGRGLPTALLLLSMAAPSLADVRDTATGGRRFTRPVPRQTVTDRSASNDELAREIDRQLTESAKPLTSVAAKESAPRAQQSKLKWRPSRAAAEVETTATENAAQPPIQDSAVQPAAFEAPRKANKTKPGADPFRDSAVQQADFTANAVELFLEQPTDAEDEPRPAARAQPAIPSIDDVPTDLLPTDDVMQTPPPIERELADRRKEYDEPCPKPDELKRIGDITNNITPEAGEFPRECGLGDSIFEPRAWPLTTFTWKASALCHKPLYFEEMALERYGHSTGPLTQPFVSGAHFFVTLPILPYLMGVEPPCECIYDLGYYRPGSCAPYMIYPIPISLRGAVLEAGAWVGGVFLIP
ncbi:MAG: hypothetical protein KF708_07645 [Pirellulales bacterium]|nr:hypothetical protein [Pirellulales bacterium]